MSNGVKAGTEGADTEYIEIGIIRKPVGLDGWCGVTLNGTTLDRLAIPCKVFIGPDVHSIKIAIIVEIRLGPKGPRCRFQGCESCRKDKLCRHCCKCKDFSHKTEVRRNWIELSL